MACCLGSAATRTGSSSAILYEGFTPDAVDQASLPTKRAYGDLDRRLPIRRNNLEHSWPIQLRQSVRDAEPFLSRSPAAIVGTAYRRERFARSEAAVAVSRKMLTSGGDTFARDARKSLLQGHAS